MKRDNISLTVAMLPMLVTIMSTATATAQLTVVSPTMKSNAVQASWRTRATDHFDIYYRRQQDGSLVDEIARVDSRGSSRRRG
jgi:hypothetical protein